jgi:hypothetical protein
MSDFWETGRNFTGHALDQMQGRGFTPTVVENALRNGARSAGNQPGTFQHIADGVKVITNEAGGPACEYLAEVMRRVSSHPVSQIDELLSDCGRSAT